MRDTLYANVPFRLNEITRRPAVTLVTAEGQILAT